MSIQVSGGGGGGGYPGVTADGFTPGGLNVAGEIVSGDILPSAVFSGGPATGGQYGIVAVFQADGSPGARLNGDEGLLTALSGQIGPPPSAIPAVYLTPHAGATDVITAFTSDQGATTFHLGAEGGIGLFDHAAPTTQATLATGAGHTVDDVITLLQSYGLCKQA